MNARLVLIGTEEFSREMLAEAVRLGANVTGAVSLARDWAEKFPEWRDLGETARALGVAHREVRSIRAGESLALVKEMRPDGLLVTGFPQLLSREMIAAAPLGAIATQASLLPKNRGLNAIPWHLLRGESEGGLSVFRVGAGCDDGPILAQRRWRIAITDTARTLYDHATAAGREMLPEALAMIERGRIEAAPQDARDATWLPKKLPDRRIDWMRNARRAYDLVRALTDPYGGAFAWLGNRRMTVWEAGYSQEPIVARPGEVVKMSPRGVELATGAGIVVLRRVQVGEASEAAIDVFEREGIRPGRMLP